MKKALWFNGIDEVLEISKKPNVDFKIHSQSLTEEIANYKIRRLLEKGFNANCFHMHIGNTKVMMKSDVIVEDSIRNLAVSESEHRILISTSSNLRENYSEYDAEYSKLVLTNSLIEANQRVKEIIKSYEI